MDKSTRSKPKTKPEKRVKSTGTRSKAVSLDALREEAAKTGDYTKVIAYKRKLKNK